MHEIQRVTNGDLDAVLFRPGDRDLVFARTVGRGLPVNNYDTLAHFEGAKSLNISWVARDAVRISGAYTSCKVYRPDSLLAETDKSVDLRVIPTFTAFDWLRRLFVKRDRLS
jgi:hypothetical protein